MIGSVVEVIQNPSDPIAWAGLAGDVVSLAVPFVSGGGTVVKAAVKSKKALDAVDTTIDIARATDLTDDALDVARALDRVNGYTKSTANAGVRIHNGYKAGLPGKEYRIPGGRIDYVDVDRRIIYELKPNNPRSIRQGIGQLKRYEKAMINETRKTGWKLRLELY